jgi:hypothetical protein
MGSTMTHKRGERGKLYVCLHDEAPAIGCGWRQVSYHVGNRHVRLRDPHTNRAKRISRAMFDKIAANAVSVRP